MKARISFLLLILSALTANVRAQKYLNVYQDNIVIKRIPTTEIDSISVTSTPPRTVNMWYNGDVFLSYAAEEIDSVTVTNVEEPISYLGVIGFNDDLYRKDMGVISSSTSGQYQSFVSGLPQKDGTLLYYAVDNALDMLEAADLKSPVKSVNFITFTDGLDLGSTMLNDTYWTSRDYLNALSSRIKNTKVKGLPINAYTVGMRGKDVTDVDLFKDNLVSLASKPSQAFEVTNLSQFMARLEDIANSIISVSSRQSVTVKVPGIDNGSRMRFVFDGRSAGSSQLYIEGTFSMQDRSLHDVTYHGMRARSGSTVQGTQSGIFLTFTFIGLQRLDGAGLISMNDIKHYYITPSASSWQINSEFRPDGNTQRTTSYTGTAVFLVLDCSSSLGSDISKVKNYANDFISLLAQNALPVSVQTPKSLNAEIAEGNEKLNVQLSWNWARFAETYDVYRSNRSYGSFVCIAKDVTETSFLDEQPLDGDNYYYVVPRGYGMSGSSSATAHIDVKLDKPQNVKAALDDNRFVINVSWDAVKYAESYSIYRSTNASSGFKVVAEGVTSTSWTETPTNYGFYYYKVYAAGHGMTSVSSDASDMVSYNHFECQELANGTRFNINGVSFTMIKVEAGTFQMGEEGVTTPVHQVTLTNDYYIGETEVTQELWTAVMGSNPSYFTGSAQLPVERVAWNECQTFISKLNALTGRNFRLPTEAEWEFAARGGNASKGYTYSGSNTIDDVAWYSNNSGSGTHEVATKSPNELGIYDMSGNVFEWCQDWYGSYSSSAQINPSGPTSGSHRVFRGGSWINAHDCRVADHAGGSPSYDVYNFIGFRLALEPVEDGLPHTKTSPNSLSFASTANTTGKAIAVRSNESWEATSNASWCKVSPGSGSNSGEVIVTVTANTSSDSRAATVTVKGLTSGDAATINVVQLGVINAASHTVTVNGVSFKMIKVEAGTFQMGEEGGAAPVHPVTLTNDYYIGETEVTQELWTAVMGSNPSCFTGSAQLPVEMVSWHDCQTFISKLNALTGCNFRLPTEAEWEFAARGGNASKGYTYSGSNTIDDVAWHLHNSGSKTHEVATKAPNELGIYDMSGNVWEWCQDWYGSYSSSAQTNPTGPTSGSSRVYRGGSWYNGNSCSRVADRSGYPPSISYYSMGFRLAL